MGKARRAFVRGPSGRALADTADNPLRPTVYVGLREDKPAEQVRRE